MIVIGSARIAENGRATGGQAGDQKQTSTPDYKGEVSMQEFYVSSKGWYVIRPKSKTHAKKIAERMEAACNNPNIGYDQGGRYGVIKNGIDTKKKTEADCSSLIREIIIEATGKDPGDFNTASEPAALEKTGLFEKKFTYSYKSQLCTGDILVTKTKGHTAVVVKGKSRAPEKLRAAKPTLRKSDTGDEVRMLQRDLDHLGFVGKDGKNLSIDGDFGSNTEHAVKSFQKGRIIKVGILKRVEKLKVDGIYGKKTYKAMKNALK